MYSNEVNTDEEFDHILNENQLFSKGIWKFKFPLPNLFELKKLFQYQELTIKLSYILDHESEILNKSVSYSDIRLLYNWKDYYEFRGINEFSLTKLVLHWPLTTYCILSKLNQCFENNRIKIHFIGVEIELNALVSFLELPILLPGYEWELQFIGDKLPNELDNFTINFKSRKIKFIIRKGFYHSLFTVGKMRDTNIVIGFNAGLGVFKSWEKTIKKLQIAEVPCFFTEYNTSAMDHTLSLLNIPKKLNENCWFNQFHNPARITNVENCPQESYSNFCIYRII